MLEKTKKFVSTHKTKIATAVTAAVIGGVAVSLIHRYGPTRYLVVSKDALTSMAAEPEVMWMGYDVKGTLLALTAVKNPAVE